MPPRVPSPHPSRVRAAAVAAAVLLPAALLHALATAGPRGGVQERRPAAAAADSALTAEVRALNAAMMAAFDRRDMKGVARFYADDARIVGPGRATVQGREAIDRYWTGMRNPRAWKLEVVEVGGSRDRLYQIGVSAYTSARDDGTESTYTCDFVVVWKRQRDGTLRIALDLYT
jgi:uncharacterized protein (TIGR02246 family)